MKKGVRSLFYPHDQRGAIAVYISLLVLLVLLTSAIVMSGILGRQLRSSQDAVGSERAFYAANSGVEHMYADLVAALNTGETGADPVEGEILYENDQTATYRARGRLIVSEDQGRAVVCIESEGEFEGQKRSIRLGPEGEDCEA